MPPRELFIYQDGEEKKKQQLDKNKKQYILTKKIKHIKLITLEIKVKKKKQCSALQLL